MGGGVIFTPPEEKIEFQKIAAGQRPAAIFHQTKFSLKEFDQVLNDFDG